MGFSNDSHPYVGRVPGEEGKWVIGGFTGHGMPRIFLCAKALVQQLLAGENGERIEWPRWFPKAFIVRSGREKRGFDISKLSKPYR
jgi:glycine/D-amino acid oxidase-like deaminating enzyme